MHGFRTVWYLSCYKPPCEAVPLGKRVFKSILKKQIVLGLIRAVGQYQKQGVLLVSAALILSFSEHEFELFCLLV